MQKKKVAGKCAAKEVNMVKFGQYLLAVVLVLVKYRPTHHSVTEIDFKEII